MKQILYMKSEMLIAWLFYQTMLQEKLIEAQQKIIELQDRIDNMSPKAISEKDEFWHLISGGVMSEEAANSDNVVLVKKFKDWNISFAEKNIKPYVNPQVYNETLNQMTRGLGTRIAQLETKKMIDKRPKSSSSVLKLDEESDAKDKGKNRLAAVQ